MPDRLDRNETPVEALSSEDLERLRAASASSGVVGMLLDGLEAAGFTEVDVAEHPDATLPSATVKEPEARSVPLRARRFAWRSRPNDAEGATTSEPATYYEALTGKPDPMRDFFVTGRRLLDVVTWIIALGLSLGLVALGIVTGASADTVVIGLRRVAGGHVDQFSLPRTPFG
jgi:hypothetical protein